LEVPFVLELALVAETFFEAVFLVLFDVAFAVEAFFACFFRLVDGFF